MVALPNLAAELLASLAVLGAMGCAHAPADAKEAPPAPWFDVFPAFPGARALASEHVHGNSMHIHWASYATPASPEEVVAFYAARIPDAERPDARHLSLRRPDLKNLSVHPSDDSYPRGEGKLEPGERTVIVVSQAIR